MERIILDCDPGHDDAVALALAKGLSDKIKVEAIIATYGNQTLDKTLTNALNLAQALEYNAPVYTGSLQPLIRPMVNGGDFHGKNGLEGPVFPPCKRTSQGNGIKAALDIVINNPGEISFVSVGPFTDLAVCLKADPRFAKSLKQIVLMGGSSAKGNVTESAEFNVFADPEAAKIVFNSGVKIIDFALDVTLQVRLTDDITNKVKAIKGKRYPEIFLASMENYKKAYLKYEHSLPAMHDPCTIAWLAQPEIFTLSRRPIDVDCKSELCYGRTVVGSPDSSSNTWFAEKANVEMFWSLFFEAVNNLH